MIETTKARATHPNINGGLGDDRMLFFVRPERLDLALTLDIEFIGVKGLVVGNRVG